MEFRKLVAMDMCAVLVQVLSVLLGAQPWLAHALARIGTRRDRRNLSVRARRLRLYSNDKRQRDSFIDRWLPRPSARLRPKWSRQRAGPRKSCPRRRRSHWQSRGWFGDGKCFIYRRHTKLMPSVNFSNAVQVC